MHFRAVNQAVLEDKLRERRLESRWSVRATCKSRKGAVWPESRLGQRKQQRGTR